LLTLIVLTGCANDPLYLDPSSGPMPQQPLVGGMTDMMGNAIDAKASLALPIKTETPSDRMKREARQAVIGAATEIPYVKVGDIEVSIEWTIKNLDAMPGQAKIELNGANQFFSYDPSKLVFSAGEEAPPTPGLAGDIPIDVPASGEISGLFTEDEVREASIDLDQITRGNFQPYRAILTISKNATQYAQLTPVMLAPKGMDPPPQTETGLKFPRVFKTDRHMTLEYSVRVRDMRDILPPKLLDAPASELQPFAPMDFTVASVTP
jgi:hypothetical protein